MDWLSDYFKRLLIDGNASPIEFGALAISAIALAITILKIVPATWRFFSPKPPPPLVAVQSTPHGHVTLSLEDYETRLKKREDELRKNLETAHAEDKTLLQAQIDELTKQQSHPEDAFNAFKTKIAELEALLGNIETEDEQAAKDALEKGDLFKADDIFERIQEAQTLNIKKAANAAYARGEIAEQQIRWKDAAKHYAEAARLDPTYDHLLSAREFAWRMGDYGNALRLGEDLIAAAKKDFGENTTEHASALNEHAISLEATGRFEEAEPLYREALAIDEKTIGKAHPDYAIHLNNLAGLLQATGRFEEAEPLYREALAILETSLGADHPNTKTGKQNLDILLANMGKSDG